MTSPATDPLVRAARFVGDFGNPFYDEERQRDVWNEASAFGLQLMIWMTLVAATVTVWVVGRPSLPYVQGGLLLLGVSCLLSIAYATRLGVDITAPAHLLRWRMVPYLLGVVVFAVGMLRAVSPELDLSTVLGAITGFAVTAGVATLVTRYRTPAGEPDEG